MTNKKQKTLYPAFPVMIVDDEESIIKTSRSILRSGGIDNIIACSDESEVLDLIRAYNVGVVLLDLVLKKKSDLMHSRDSGEKLMEEIKNEFPDIEIIIITGQSSVNSAVNCMKMGAFDYLEKPIEKDRMTTTVKNAVRLREIRAENISLKDKVLTKRLSRPEVFSKIITASEPVYSIFQYMEAIAYSSDPVLITGETGVGKSLFAEAIHKLSGRKGDLVVVDLTNISGNLFTSELFGSRKGAFSSAVNRLGRIDAAGGGTFVLDEIAELDADTQSKLLRLVQEREYTPVGANITKKTDARIIAVTNKNLNQECEQDRFRRDLFYRLGVHHLEIPPLRERKEDIIPLAKFFCRRHGGDKIKELSDQLLEAMKKFDFPGNVRELENFFRGLVNYSGGEVLSADTFLTFIRRIYGKDKIALTGSEETSFEIWERFEILPTIEQTADALIAEAFKRTKGNQSETARLLGISRPTLNRRLKRMNLLN